jgi:hypothetical protein
MTITPTIRYWSAHDQRNARTVTFSTKQKAVDAYTFYRGAGIRCELCY